MGYDLYGKNEQSEVGKYFGNNIWWWGPLANYVLEQCWDIMKRSECEYWDSNDGQWVSAETALAIANRLDELIASGHTENYAQTMQAANDAIPDETCYCCSGAGLKANGCCSVCNGTGQTKPFGALRPFSVENVQEFSEFCRASDGFNIC